MPIEVDKEKGNVVVTVGKGDVIVRGDEDGLFMWDMHEENPIGKSMRDQLTEIDELNPNSDTVLIRGSYPGMRAVAFQLLRAISCTFDKDKPEIPATICKCVTCECEGNEFAPLVDTGVFMICGACLRSMVRIIEKEQGKEEVEGK